MQEDAVGRPNVEWLSLDADLHKRNVGLLDEIGGERAADGMEEIWRDEPAKNHGDERRSKEQDEQDAEESAAHGSLL